MNKCQYVQDRTLHLVHVSVNVYLYYGVICCVCLTFTCVITSFYTVLCDSVFVYVVCVHVPMLQPTQYTLYFVIVVVVVVVIKWF